MRPHLWLRVAGLSVLLALSQAAGSAAQNAPIRHESGQAVSPAFEGWYKNSDGTFSMSFGYMNRNFSEEVTIPVGPNNRFEPGLADQGQPTYFLPRRQTGVFTVVVPKDFGDKKLTWTLVAHGETISIPGHLRPEWEIDALKEVTSGNTPPVIRFETSGKPGQGPAGTTTSMNVALPSPATLNVWATDDGIRKRENEGRRGPDLTLAWSKFRGPGKVTFGDPRPAVRNGKATTTATFSDPGEYVLRVLAADSSGGQALVMAGGFYCCWTNGYVKVTVAPGSRSSK